MDLKQFVSETLTQIVAGVDDARGKISQINGQAKINPDWFYDTEEQTHAKPTPVEFDVALVVSSASENSNGDKLSGDASAGILSVFKARIGTELQSTESDSQKNETVSRVKFSVLLAQPADISIVRKKEIPKKSTDWMA